MSEDYKKELLENSEIIKTQVIKLFEGQPYTYSLYALMHAASEIIKKEKGISYKQAIIEGMVILYHLESCTGCDVHKEASDD